MVGIAEYLKPKTSFSNAHRNYISMAIASRFDRQYQI